VTNWRVRLVERTRKQGQEWLGGVLVNTGKVSGGAGVTKGVG